QPLGREPFVQTAQLVELAPRIGERLGVGRQRRPRARAGGCLRPLGRGERSGPPLLTGAHAAVPEVAQRLEPGLERAQAEAEAVVADRLAVERADEGLD